ncbi:MAG TPA: putative metallopeptidase [Patescibacteria group bacterium]
MALRYLRTSKKRTKNKKIEWDYAPDIERRIAYLIELLHLDWLTASSIHCVRSNNAQTRAIARIWGLGRVWQITLNLKPAYVLEVISEKFDRESEEERDKILLHELVHIPRNFSGALLPHKKHGKGSFHDRLDRMIERYYEMKK